MGDREETKTAVTVTSAQQWNKYAFGCAMLASMTSILMGYNIGVMSGAALFIKDDLNIDDTKLEIVIGIINLYSLVGSAAAGRMSDWIGRRCTIVFSAAVFFVGALTMSLANSYAILMVGRFIAGVGVGYALVIAPVYAAEVAPASARGFLSSLPDVFINVGILLGYASNLAFAGLPPHVGWRVMFGAGAVPPVFLAAGVLAMPESPRWLVMQGRTGEARRVLSKTSHSPEEAELRLAEIQEAAGGVPESSTDDSTTPLLKKGNGVWREIFIKPTPEIVQVLIVSLGLQFFQQASGIDSVVLYMPRVFEMAGIKGDTVQLGATVAVGFVKTGSILVAVFLSDRIGRRPLLLCSAGGVVASLLVLGAGLMVIDHHPDEKPTWAAVLCVAMVVSFAGSFSIGLGPVAWVYTSEILPLRLRAQGASLAAAMNRIMSAVVTMTFISLYEAITVAGSFFLYAGITAVCWVFIYKFLPETRGRSLEELEHLFGKRSRTKEEEKDGRVC